MNAITNANTDDNDDYINRYRIEGRHVLAFGSCNDPYQYNALWPIVQAHQPTAFIWCGDAIYADKPSSFSLPKSPSVSSTSTTPAVGSNAWNRIRPYLPFSSHTERIWKKHTCATPEVFDRDYQQLLNVPGYRELLSGDNQSPTSSSSSPHIFGTLDDHDYGCNNADRTFPYKYESGMAFLKFLNASSSSMMYQRGLRGEGIYGVQLYDFAQPPGPRRVISDEDANIDADLERFSSHQSQRHSTYSNQTVAVFVLDVRTHKTPWKTHWYERFFQTDMDGDFLGPRQWEWLQQSVQNSHATIHVVVSGIQFHPYRYPDGNIAESWSQYPRAQQDLYNILLSTPTPTILVSGDVHMTQLLQKDCVPHHAVVSHDDTDHHIPSASQSSVVYPRRPLIEMTTSGMTHSWGTLAVPFDAASSSSPSHQHSYYDWYSSYISKWMIHLLHYTCPWTDIISIPSNSNKTTAKVGLQYSLEQNFGEIEIDFAKERVQLRTIGTNAQPLLQLQYTFDELSSSPSDRRTTDPNQPQQHPYLSMKDYQKEIRNHPQLYDHISKDDPNQWVCINHRGHGTAFQLVTGYMTSIALLTILAPLPVLVPSTLCLVLVLLLVRLNRRRSSHTTSRRRTIRTNTTITTDSVLQHPTRFLATTTTKRQIVFQQPATTTTISTFWRLTWMPTVPESTNGKKSFFPSAAMTTHHHYKKY
jgi:PhoD-like phosphatase